MSNYCPIQLKYNTNHQKAPSFPHLTPQTSRRQPSSWHVSADIPSCLLFNLPVPVVFPFTHSWFLPCLCAFYTWALMLFLCNQLFADCWWIVCVARNKSYNYYILWLNVLFLLAYSCPFKSHKHIMRLLSHYLASETNYLETGSKQVRAIMGLKPTLSVSWTQNCLFSTSILAQQLSLFMSS